MLTRLLYVSHCRGQNDKAAIQAILASAATTTRKRHPPGIAVLRHFHQTIGRAFGGREL